MKVTLNISKAVIVTGFGTDKVVLYTDLPCAIVSNSIGDPVCLGFDTTQGTGEAYVSRIFPGIPVEVINTRG